MKKVSVFAVLLAITLLLGCLSESSTFDRSGISDTGVSRGFEVDAGFAAPSSAPKSSDISTTRKMIMTAYLRAEVNDFVASSREVERITNELGGFVSDSDLYVTSTGQRRGTITLRVPEKQFLNVIQGLEEIGETKSKTISGQDVTEEYIDLDSRLRNLKRQEERLLDILDKAETVEDLLEVERELGRIRGDIESFTGRLRYLDDRINLAMITIDLYEPEPVTQSFGIRDTLRMSFEGFVATTTGIIVLIGVLMPLAIIASLAFILFRRLRRKSQ